MPIYEYKCDKGHAFEVIQKMSDASLTECEECGARVARVLHSPAVHFKGSGFYNTDYGKKKGGGDGGTSEGGGDSGDYGRRMRRVRVAERGSAPVELAVTAPRDNQEARG